MKPIAEQHSTYETIAEGRYLVESTLGKGGMGVVYKVRDTVSDKRVALKRVLVFPKGQTKSTGESVKDTDRRGQLEAYLRREYQMLQSLSHPNIIEVYDFGVDEKGPYYTMELLDGSDLRELAPVEWKRVCVILRDIASCLALIHSRRLLHRDLSPRNLRCTSDGRVKLIDFGAMTHMGSPKDQVGTPPFVPPEVVYGQSLDQRSDIYSLGALGYWLLTRKNAYPVRYYSGLRDAWRSKPLPPSSAVKDIPEVLDRLIMSLFSLDPLARPKTAFEVIERLNAIGDLKPDEQLEVTRAYMTTPTLVGREKPLLRVRKQVIRSLRRRGGTILVKGIEGVGRSRFLDACVLEGKLVGLVVLRANALDAHSGDYGVVKTLVKKLLREISDIALDTAQPHLTILRRIIPKLKDFNKTSEPTSEGAPQQDGDPQ